MLSSASETRCFMGKIGFGFVGILAFSQMALAGGISSGTPHARRAVGIAEIAISDNQQAREQCEDGISAAAQKVLERAKKKAFRECVGYKNVSEDPRGYTLSVQESEASTGHVKCVANYPVQCW